MIHINILSPSGKTPFYPHWDKERFPEADYDIRENSHDDIDWDCVVVYQNIKQPINIKCKQGNLIYISGEPPLSTPYPHVYIEQFDYVVMPHPQVKYKKKLLSHGFLCWTVGKSIINLSHRYDFKDIRTLEPEKTKLFSVVSTSKKMMPGHQFRVAIINQLIKDYPGVVDVYGRGYNPIEYKADALLPYRFHICMENSSIPDYWTEKISDPILMQCIPIYAGCSNIEKYLGNEGYFKFDIRDYSSLKIIIDKLLCNPEEEYKKRKKELERLREIIMDKENIIPFIIKYLRSQELEKSERIISYQINPLDYYWQFKVQKLLVRVKRLFIRLHYNLAHCCKGL